MTSDKLNFIGPHEGKLRFTFKDGRIEHADDPKGVARLLGQLKGESVPYVRNGLRHRGWLRGRRRGYGTAFAGKGTGP